MCQSSVSSPMTFGTVNPKSWGVYFEHRMKLSPSSQRLFRVALLGTMATPLVLVACLVELGERADSSDGFRDSFAFFPGNRPRTFRLMARLSGFYRAHVARGRTGSNS